MDAIVMFNYSTAEVANLYVSDRILETRYEQQIINVSKRVTEISAVHINRYLKQRVKSVSAITAANERRVLLTLWTWAYENHFVAEPPRGVMKIKTQQPPVVAWRITTCKKIVKYALENFSGNFKNGLSKGKFLAAWCLIAYETGARAGDIHSWTRKNLKGSNVVWTVRKTGVSLSRPISPKTQALVRELLDRSPDDSIFEWVCCRRYAFLTMRKMLDACGIEGSSKFFRRTAGTQAEMAQAGSGNLMLGHKTRSVFLTHYYDITQASSNLPELPAIS